MALTPVCFLSAADGEEIHISSLAHSRSDFMQLFSFKSHSYAMSKEISFCLKNIQSRHISSNVLKQKHLFLCAINCYSVMLTGLFFSTKRIKFLLFHHLPTMSFIKKKKKNQDLCTLLYTCYTSRQFVFNGPANTPREAPSTGASRTHAAVTSLGNAATPNTATTFYSSTRGSPSVFPCER